MRDIFKKWWDLYRHFRAAHGLASDIIEWLGLSATVAVWKVWVMAGTGALLVTAWEIIRNDPWPPSVVFTLFTFVGINLLFRRPLAEPHIKDHEVHNALNLVITNLSSKPELTADVLFLTRVSKWEEEWKAYSVDAFRHLPPTVVYADQTGLPVRVPRTFQLLEFKDPAAPIFRTKLIPEGYAKEWRIPERGIWRLHLQLRWDGGVRDIVKCFMWSVTSLPKFVDCPVGYDLPPQTVSPDPVAITEARQANVPDANPELRLRVISSSFSRSENITDTPGADGQLKRKANAYIEIKFEVLNRRQVPTTIDYCGLLIITENGEFKPENSPLERSDVVLQGITTRVTVDFRVVQEWETTAGPDPNCKRPEFMEGDPIFKLWIRDSWGNTWWSAPWRSSGQEVTGVG